MAVHGETSARAAQGVEDGMGWLNRPVLILVAALIALFILGAGLPKVVKDPSVDAFVPLDHPAAQARDAARETFGLEDPVVLALTAPEGGSIFNPVALVALRTLHDTVRQVPGVKKNDVISLASEKAIRGQNGDLLVDPILKGASDQSSLTDQEARLAQSHAMSMPMLKGLLVSEAGDLATLIVPVEDPNKAEAVTAALLETAQANTPEGYTVHMAGVATMNARLAHMVSTDTKIFIPLALVIVLVFLYMALGSAKAVVGPLVIIAGSAASAIGVLGWVDAKYYLITSALPVVVMAIAVADSVHISAFYLAARRSDPALSAKGAVRSALSHTWMPVTLTSITTVAGFIGLSFGAAMKPISEFGLFAAVGVVAAWALSLTVLPAVLILLDLKAKPAAKANVFSKALDGAAQAMTRIAVQAPKATAGIFALILAVLALLASQASFDYERKRYFQPDDSVRIADEAISSRLGGINFLDVVVSAPDEGGILTADALSAIQDLSADIAAMPHVTKVTGIDDYIAHMHHVLTDAPAGTLPQRKRAAAQYMFLYEASAPPEDFKQELDYLQQKALIRAQLATDQYAETKPVVDQLKRRLESWTNDHDLDAQISGRVAVNEGWMTLLAENHFRGLGLAAVLVFLAAVVSFKSLKPAILVMIPVGTGVLFIYAMMGALGVDIAPATSMMAAISTGLGVDFGIHLIAHVRRQQHQGVALHSAFSGSYLLVARACFVSAAALGLALSVLLVSAVPVLQWFGLLIATGAAGSLIGAMFILPALTLLRTAAPIKDVSHA